MEVYDGNLYGLIHDPDALKIPEWIKINGPSWFFQKNNFMNLRTSQ